jgi:hypothetical protein
MKLEKAVDYHKLAGIIAVGTRSGLSRIFVSFFSASLFPVMRLMASPPLLPGLSCFARHHTCLDTFHR